MVVDNQLSVPLLCSTSAPDVHRTSRLRLGWLNHASCRGLDLQSETLLLLLFLPLLVSHAVIFISLLFAVAENEGLKLVAIGGWYVNVGCASAFEQ